MALTATIYRVEVTLSDVDRGVYETLDLRVARHPSESMRYMVARTLAYALSFEEGIEFSKGGLSNADEPPIQVRDRTGLLLAWIDVGVPSAERLHKATKAARRVSVFTHQDIAQLHREAKSKAIHRAEEVEVYGLAPAFLDAVAERMDRTTKLELVRNEGQLYVTVGKVTLEGQLAREALVPPA